MLNPKTGKMQECQMLDDFFGQHHYGYYFEGDDFVYDVEDTKHTKKLTEQYKENLNKRL